MLDVLEYKGWGDVTRVAYLVIEGDCVGAALHGFKTHDLPPHFLLFHWLQHLHHYALIRQQVEGFEDFGVAAPTDLANDFIVILPVKANGRVGIVTVGGVFFFDADFFDGVSVVFRQLLFRDLQLSWPQSAHFQTVHQFCAQRVGTIVGSAQAPSRLLHHFKK